MYFIDNSTSTTLTYDGTTVIFTALRNVIPCTTYHLKLAIADAGDEIFDSGVFLKAGSLNSNAISITPVGGTGSGVGSPGLGAPTPYCVRNCLPGQFVFTRPVATPTPLVIKYIIDGSAVNGVDYTTIADSVTIAAGTTVANVYITALSPPSGVDTVVLKVLSPYLCAGGLPNVIDSATLLIFDSLAVNILQDDTAICYGQCIDLKLERFPGDSLFVFTWLPTTGLTYLSADSDSVRVCPPATMVYQAQVVLPGTGCPPSYDEVEVAIKLFPDVDAGPDTITCKGVPYRFNPTVNPSTQPYTWTWTPATGLDSPDIRTASVLALDTGTTTYIVQANPGAATCSGYDTVVVTVIPDDIQLFNTDTPICAGGAVEIHAVAHPAFNIAWTPTLGVDSPFILEPTITPDTTRTYTVLATFPGCPIISKTLLIDVQPQPIVDLGPNVEKCQFDTLHIRPAITPAGYPFYTYLWVPGADIQNPSARDIVFSGQSTVGLTLQVSTPASCKGSDDLIVTVRSGNFGTLEPGDGDTAICPADSLLLIAGGGVHYTWSPAIGLTAPDSGTTYAQPVSSTDYSVIITDEYGCTDTLAYTIAVRPGAVLSLPDSVVLYPGQSYQMDPGGNGLYFSWFPTLGLSASNIANPVATPPVNTRYFVTATSEAGCVASDTVDVLVKPETIIVLPNAFSPGSAPNATLKIMREGIAALNGFSVYNRWGNLVFQTRDLDEGWDGRFGGEPQPMGVYIYTVDAVLNNGRAVKLQGNVTLIR